MQAYTHFLCTLQLLFIRHCNTCFVQFEAEYGVSDGVQIFRAPASNGITVLLKNGNRIEHTFRIGATSFCSVIVANIAYSNEGLADTIILSIDNTIVGSFESTAQTGGNVSYTINNTGILGNPVNLFSGEHSLSVQVTSAGDDGVEIDRTIISVVCINTEAGPEEKCPSSEVEITATESDDIPEFTDETTEIGRGDGLSTGGRIGIGSAVPFIAAGLVLLVLLYLYCRKKED